MPTPNPPRIRDPTAFAAPSEPHAAYRGARHYATERANRNPVVGRKNHYGSRSKRDTEVAAILYSTLETTRNAGVDAHAYLELAVERAQDGLPVALPHELEVEVAARAAQHLALAAASAKGKNHAWPVGGV